MRTKVVSFFHIFQELSNKKKITAIRPKMTKTAPREVLSLALTDYFFFLIFNPVTGVLEAQRKVKFPPEKKQDDREGKITLSFRIVNTFDCGSYHCNILAIKIKFADYFHAEMKMHQSSFAHQQIEVQKKLNMIILAIDLAGNSLLQQLLTAPVLTQTCWCREKLL